MLSGVADKMYQKGSLIRDLRQCASSKTTGADWRKNWRKRLEDDVSQVRQLWYSYIRPFRGE